MKIENLLTNEGNISVIGNVLALAILMKLFIIDKERKE